MPTPVVIVTYYNVLGTGGMETHVRRLAKGLSSLGHTGRVITPADPALGAGAPAKIGNFDLVVVGPPTEKWFPLSRTARIPAMSVRYWLRNFGVTLAAVEALRGLRARVLYVPGPVNLPSTAALNLVPFWVPLRWIRGTRVVLGARGAASHWYERRVVARLFALEESAQIRFADIVTAVDHYYAEVLFPAKHRQKYRVITNGVDTTRFSPRGNSRDGTVTFVGRLTPDRGIDVFLAAVEKLRGADRRFRVVGDGPLRAWLLERVRAKSLPVEWSGSVPHAEMPAVYNTSYLVVNPSTVEGIGNITLEAMACGRCVIRAASRYGEFAIQDGINGMLFPGGNAEALARKIDDAQRNPDVVERLGREARATVMRHFTEADEAKAYSELFESLACLA